LLAHTNKYLLTLTAVEAGHQHSKTARRSDELSVESRCKS